MALSVYTTLREERPPRALLEVAGADPSRAGRSALVETKPDDEDELPWQARIDTNTKQDVVGGISFCLHDPVLNLYDHESHLRNRGSSSSWGRASQFGWSEHALAPFVFNMITSGQRTGRAAHVTIRASPARVTIRERGPSPNDGIGCAGAVWRLSNGTRRRPDRHLKRRRLDRRIARRPRVIARKGASPS